MRKLWLILAAVLFLALPASSQTISGSITASGSTCATTNACIAVALPSNAGAATFTISGTFSATLQFEVSGDGTNFVAVNSFPPNSTTAVTSTTAGGTWTASVAAMQVVRVRCSAFTSGSATVTIQVSPATSASLFNGGGGGGGGSGTVTNVATTSPITGGPITTTGTIACPTCGVTGSPLSQFAATTSAQLAGVLSDETGTGLAVFGTNPVLTTPNLGTPSALVLTNATLLPCGALPSLTGDTTSSAGSCANVNVALNGVNLAGLATGILKNTTATGAPSIAVNGVDFGLCPPNTTANQYLVGSSTAGTCSNGSLTEASGVVTTTEPGSFGASLSTTADGVHPSLVSLVGNTTLPSLAANTVNLIGPPSATPTSYSIQVPTAIPTTNHMLSCVITGTNCLLTDVGYASNAIPLADLATQAANTVVGALTATNPSALAVPSCSGATNALSWTSGTGFGCNTISGSGGAAALSNTTSVTASNPTAATDTQLMEISLSAGYLNTAGQPYVVYGAGVLNTTVASVPQVTITAKLCSVSGCGSGTVTSLGAIQSSALNTTAITNATWTYGMLVTTVGTGASCNFISKANPGLEIDLAGTVTATADSVFLDSNTAVTSPNQNCANALFLDFFVQQSTTGSSNSYKQLIAEIAPQATPTATSIACSGVTNGQCLTTAQSPTNKTYISASDGNNLTKLNYQATAGAITGNSAAQSVYLYNLPQNFLASGSCIRASVGFQHTTGSAGVTLNWSFVAHGAALASSGTSFSSTVTTYGQSSVLVCNNVGSQTTQQINQGQSYFGTSAGFAGGETTTSIDTTASGGADLAFTFNVANTDQVTPKFFLVERIQ